MLHGAQIKHEVHPSMKVDTNQQLEWIKLNTDQVNTLLRMLHLQRISVASCGRLDLTPMT
jgi:hypothetical protein